MAPVKSFFHVNVKPSRVEKPFSDRNQHRVGSCLHREINLAEMVPAHRVHRSDRRPDGDLRERVKSRLHPPKATRKTWGRGHEQEHERRDGRAPNGHTKVSPVKHCILLEVDVGRARYMECDVRVPPKEPAPLSDSKATYRPAGIPWLLSLASAPS